MPLKTTVLISSITNLSDARYATGMGVDYLGFQLNDDHTDFIGYENYTAITTWLTGVKFAGEFDDSTSPEFIITRAKEFGFSAVITTNQETIKALKNHDLFLIQKEVINDKNDLTNISNSDADLTLIESENNLSLTQEEISIASSKVPLLIGTSISPETINSMIEYTDIEGIALKGSEEIRTGFVDLDAMADILEAIEID